MSTTYKGKIIYWNSYFKYGFIECTELSENFHFHKSKCTYEDLQLLDNVSFQISIITTGKHKGKKVAIEIHLTHRGNLKNYDLRIGTIQDWNGKFGFIDYPTDGKKIFLFHTRLINSVSIQNNDLIVFSPIVSTKDTTQIFAFFAYHISIEKDLSFLKSQYEKYQIPALKEFILNSTNIKQLTIEEKFELEIISNSQNYLDLVALLTKYKKDFSFTPDYNLLSNYVSTTYLIQLWESEIIKSYNIDTIKEYFIRTNADTKRLIILKLSGTDKNIILDFYFNHLHNQNKLNRINNDLKTFLDIIYRNEKTRTYTLYEKTKQHLLSVLTPEELINLWLYEYINTLSESIVIENFNIGDKSSIKLLLQKKDENEKPKYADLISKIYEQYFIDIANGNKSFEEEYPNLVRYLKIFNDDFNERYKGIIDILQKTLNEYQQFVLWTLEIKIKFDAYSFAKNNINKINHYYRLKFVLRYLNENENIDLKTLEFVNINIDGLKEFAINYKWNELIYPTKIIEREDVNSFLNDTIDYNRKFRANIDVLELSSTIYNSIDKYNEVHIRLWLFFLTDKEYYNYTGFREPFKKLSIGEKKYFRDRANEKDFSEIIESEILEVKPCINFEKINDSTMRYNAYVENIYFSIGNIRLRLENGEYTNKIECEYSSTGLNRIPTKHYLNKIPIELIVKSNNIIEITGLEELFSQIHTGEIEKALNTNTNKYNLNNQNNTYTEDWQLRKEIINYLNTNQIYNIDNIIVHEPKNLYRRLDENSGIDEYEKTILYTIKTNNIFEYGIVWENIDLSEDRSTYIFKCTIDNHNMQIKKIANAIVSLAQLRSTLSSEKEEKELIIFKNNFGFITSIRKQRGKNQPFSNWLKKLNDALIQPIPELPSNEEMQELNNWTLNKSHTARIVKTKHQNYRPSSIIREQELSTTDIFTIKQNENKDQEKAGNIIKTNYQLSLLKALKAFNQFFTENVKVKM